MSEFDLGEDIPDEPKVDSLRLPPAPPPAPKAKKVDPNEVFKTWKATPNPQTTGELLKAIGPDISNAVSYHTGGNDPVAMGYGRRLAIESMAKYDPDKASIRTYLNRQLQPLIRWNAKRNIGVNIPERIVAEFGTLKRVSDELNVELGRSPSIEELADRTGIPPKRIAKVRKASPLILAGSTTIAEGDDYERVTAEDMPVDYDGRTEWANFIRNDLGDVDRVILDHSLGLNNADILSNQAIAKKLRITPAAVSQRRLRIQALLDQQDQLSPFR